MSTAADTTDEAARVQAEVFARMNPEDRLLRAFYMSDLMVRIAEEGVRSRHPDYEDPDVRVAVIRQRLGDELFTAAFPESPLLDV
ncbi:MAG TPA: hypothetical protein VFN21_09745 [Acidimicrobiales bacterium]|nr:hypothetical protein [Acidimicrobiales bacterium]